MVIVHNCGENIKILISFRSDLIIKITTLARRERYYFK